MGLSPFKNSISSLYRNVAGEVEVLENPNPDPRKYTVIRYEEILGNLTVELVYDGCTNYEGRKVLVYEGVKYADLMKQSAIDPHFSEDKEIYSPVARFEPTKRGWELARQICFMLDGLGIGVQPTGEHAESILRATKSIKQEREDFSIQQNARIIREHERNKELELEKANLLSLQPRVGGG